MGKDEMQIALERFLCDLRKQQALEGIDVYGHKVKPKEGESLEDALVREIKEQE